MAEDNIYRPYTRLVRIRICGRWFEVPENNILLRCFQYIAPRVPYGPFCWNGDCENDRISFRRDGSDTMRAGLSCQTLVSEGMEIDEISPELRRALAPALEMPDEGSPVEAGCHSGTTLASRADDSHSQPGPRKLGD